MRLHELNEGLDANQKRVGQVAGEESAKDIGPVLGKEQKQHPFKGRLVGEDAVNEVAPPGMEDWIKDRKADFKKRYGDRWQEVLYATAWKQKNNESIEENSSQGYFYLQGGIDKSKKFATKQEALAHREEFFQFARVPRITLRYKEAGKPSVVLGEYNLNEQGVAEGYKEERLKGCKCQQRQGDNKKCPIHGVQEGVAEGTEQEKPIKKSDWFDPTDMRSPEKQKAAYLNHLAAKKKNKNIKEQDVAEAEKNPHTSALGKALYRDLSKEKKASPAQQERNKERWAKRQAAMVGDPAPQHYRDQLAKDAAEYKKGVAEGSLNEFAPDSDGSDEDANLHKYARMWYNGDLATQQQVEQILDRMGWEIGELESEEGGAFVVRSGDENGDTYIGFAADDLTEASDEKIADRYSQDEWDDKMQRLKKLAGMGELKTVWDPVKRVYKNVPVNQEKK